MRPPRTRLVKVAAREPGSIGEPPITSLNRPAPDDVPVWSAPQVAEWIAGDQRQVDPGDRLENFRLLGTDDISGDDRVVNHTSRRRQRDCVSRPDLPQRAEE